MLRHSGLKGTVDTSNSVVTESLFIVDLFHLCSSWIKKNLCYDQKDAFMRSPVDIDCGIIICCLPFVLVSENVCHNINAVLVENISHLIFFSSLMSWFCSLKNGTGLLVP